MKAIKLGFFVTTLLISAVSSPAKIIVVNTTNNISPGVGQTNLVQAINLLADGDTIQFNIPGTPGQVHYLLAPPTVDGTSFPIITRNNVTIDGYSQPGASPNTNPIHATNNAQLKICLDARNGYGTSMGQITNFIVVPSRPGYGDDEWAVLGVFGGTNVHIRGLAILSAPTGDDGNGGTGDIKAISLARSHTASCADWHISGCWFGIDPATRQVAYLPDNTTLAIPTISIAAYRHRDISGGPLPDVYPQPGTIGVAANSANPRAEFNVFVTGYGFDSEGLNFRISGNFWNVLPDGFTSADVSVLNGGAQMGDGYIEIGRSYNNLTIGTDGDGVNDADEGNVFGGMAENGAAVMDLYSGTGTNIIIAGNYFNVAIDGVTRFTNVAPIASSFSANATVQFGSDFDGISDALEANRVYNVTNIFDRFFNGTGDSLNPGVRLSFRGNATINNESVPYSYANGTGARLNNFTNYEGRYLDTNVAIIPTLYPSNTYPRLKGTFAPGIGAFTNVIVDVYQLDPEGWNLGKALGYSELTDSATYTNGFAQGSRYLGSFTVANSGSFDLNVSGLNLGSGLVTVTANYSADPVGTHRGQVHTSNFSNPVNFGPTLNIVRSGGNLVISWDAEAGPFTLQSTPSLLPTAWSNVSPQPPTVLAAGNRNTKTVSLGSGPLYFRLVP